MMITERETRGTSGTTLTHMRMPRDTAIYGAGQQPSTPALPHQTFHF